MASGDPGSATIEFYGENGPRKHVSHDVQLIYFHDLLRPVLNLDLYLF